MADNRLPNVTIEEGRIMWRNFAGEEGMYNAKGVRNFHVVLDEENGRAMQEDGWNVKYREPREEGDDGLWHMEVTVRYDNIPPRVVLVTSKGRTTIDESMIELLDYADIAKVDMILNPYHWTLKTGKSGVKAYLKSMYVTIQEDELEKKYEDIPELELSGKPKVIETPKPKAIESGKTEDDEDEDIVDAEIVED